jgi:hypothetical protein
MTAWAQQPAVPVIGYLALQVACNKRMYGLGKHWTRDQPASKFGAMSLERVTFSLVQHTAT